MDAARQSCPQQLVFGLALGAIYGLIALGYTMVYGILLMINFAHGELFMIGAYVGWAVLIWLINAQLRRPASGVGGAGAAADGDVGVRHPGHVTLERFAYRPLYTRGATRLGPLISAVGASIFLQNAVMLTQGARMKVYMTSLLFPRSWYVQIGGVRISALVLVMISVALLLMWLLNALVQRTTLGRCMRAVAEDREVAAVMGVNVRRVISLTFLLGSALGGAAGVLVGLYYTQIDFFMGYSAGLKAFTAAVLGGIGNLKGAMLGGIVLGLDRKPGGDLPQSGLPRRGRVRGADPGAGVPPDRTAGRDRAAGEQGVTGDAERSGVRSGWPSCWARWRSSLPLVAPNDYVVGVLARICLYATLALGLERGGRASPDCWISATWRSSASAPICTPSSPRRTSACTCRFCSRCRIVVLGTALFGILIGAPTLRLGGDYLAIVTLGFGEITYLLLLNLDRPVNITNGPSGIIDIDPAGAVRPRR